MNDNPYSPPAASIELDVNDPVGLAVSIVCPSCQSNIHIGDDRCPKCEREVTRDEKRALQRRWEASDPVVATASESTYWGRFSIGVAAVLALVQVVWTASVPDVMTSNLVVALVFIGLFGLSFGRPLVACVGALIVFSLLWLAQVVFAPLQAFQGILIRVLMLSSLMAGVSAEWAMQRRRRALARARSTRPDRNAVR